MFGVRTKRIISSVTWFTRRSAKRTLRITWWRRSSCPAKTTKAASRPRSYSSCWLISGRGKVENIKNFHICPIWQVTDKKIDEMIKLVDKNRDSKINYNSVWWWAARHSSFPPPRCPGYLVRWGREMDTISPPESKTPLLISNIGSVVDN